MSPVRVPIQPSVLRWALHQGGFDGSVTDAHPEAEAWLRREKQPTLQQLESLAQKTRVPYGMLFLPTPPVPEAIPIPDMRTPGGAVLVAPSSELLDVLHDCQLRQDWYRDHMLAMGADPVPLVGRATLHDDPEAVGETLRRDLGLDSLPPGGTPAKLRAALVSALEDKGVLVMISGYVGNNTRRTLDPAEFRGFALSDDLAPLVFVNGAEAKTAQNFTLLHEAAHLLLGHSALSDVRLSSGGNTEEAWCNRVAAAALVPLPVVRRYRALVEEDVEQAVADLARLCKVSRAVAVLRLKAAGLVSPSTADHLLEGLQDEKGLAGGPAESGGDFYRNVRYRLGAPFISAVVASAREGGTSYRDAFRLLGTHKRTVMDEMAEKVVAA